MAVNSRAVELIHLMKVFFEGWPVVQYPTRRGNDSRVIRDSNMNRLCPAVVINGDDLFDVRILGGCKQSLW